MIPNRLILRETNSPFVTPYDDTNSNSVLSRKQLDGNFIYLKGETIYSAETAGSNVILKKLNGNDITIDLSSFTGGTGTGTTEQDNKFRYHDIGDFMLGGRGVDVSNPSGLFDSAIENYLANDLSIIVNDDELIVIIVSATVYGTFYQITRKYLFPNLLGKGTYNAGDFTLDDLQLVYNVSEQNVPIDNGVNTVVYPLNSDMEISGLTANCDDFFTLINSSGPYYIGDIDTNYFFRFLCYGVSYIYFYDPITGGLDPEYVGTGYPATNFADYTLFYNSSLETPQSSSSSQLERIIEVGNVGWRILGRNPANYNNIGEGAIDFSLSDITGSTNGASGTNSFAHGYQTRATGTATHAEGIRSQSNGVASHAEGFQTQANGGAGSHAEGRDSIANGDSAHAEGDTSLADGDASHAEGFNTIANGNHSHAEGAFTVSDGNASHAEGSGSQAVGSGSHAEGFSTQAIGAASHAEGDSTIASGDSSHAGGNNSVANGDTSFIHGENSIVNGDYSIVLGRNITGNTADTTYVDNLNINTEPTLNNSLTKVLARDTDGSVNEMELTSLNTIFSGTYATLSALTMNNELIVGNKYILTDYQTKYIINGSDSSTRQQVHTVIGSAGAYSQFTNVPATIAANGDVVTVVFAPSGATVTSGQSLTIVDYFNVGFIRFSPQVIGAANIGVQIRFEKQRFTNVPNDSVINDVNGKPVIKPTGVLNTEVHDDLPYMSMTGVENPSPIVEELVLTAIDSDTFSQNAESLTFVGDSLLYDFNNNIIYDDNGNFKDTKKGTILKRTNVNNTISVDKDWRVQRYRRYRLDDTNWNAYLLKKELSGLSGTSGSTIYKISTINYCTNNNPTLSVDHRYLAPEPYLTNFYTDFAKTVANPFLSGTTTAPGVDIGQRLISIGHVTEYSNDISLPISGFSGTTLAKDFHIIPISSGSPTSTVSLFKVNNLSNVVTLTNSQRYGSSANIYVNSTNGNMFNSSFMTGPNIVNTKDINRLTSIDYLTLKNYENIENTNTLGYVQITNRGIIINSTFGQGFIGSGVNEYSEHYIGDNSFILNTIFGSNRTDGLTFNNFLSNKSLIINRTAGATEFNGRLYLTLYKNFAGVYGSKISLNSFTNQITGKGYYGYVYDFNVAILDTEVHNFNDNKYLIYNKIDSSFITSFVTVSTVQ